MTDRPPTAYWGYTPDEAGKILYEHKIANEPAGKTLAELDVKPKTWGEMDDAEKGALLLAHHQGETIQHKIFPHADEVYKWQDSSEPMFNDIHAYRVRKEPVRETVTLKGAGDSAGNFWFRTGSVYPDYVTHAITFDLVGGEPDCASITMAKLDEGAEQ